MAIETTLVLVKPDGVQRGLSGEIIRRLEQTGLKLVGLKLMQVSRELAGKHYGEHEGKPFYNGLVDYITASPVVALALEGPNAISITRKMMGVTKPAEAAPGTIRGDFGVDIGRNLIHGSANESDAKREVSLFFSSDELLRWDRTNEGWITE
jgi:nucleoside-diphosphate kinase